MADQERLVTTLMELIKIDSPSGEEDAMDAEVSSRLESLGLNVSHDSYNNIIARLKMIVWAWHSHGTVMCKRGCSPSADR